MTYKEAIKQFDNSRRKMAYALGLSVQAVAKWAKNPHLSIPHKRIDQIKQLMSQKKGR